MTIFLGILAYLVIGCILFWIFKYLNKKNDLSVDPITLIIMGVLWPLALIDITYVIIKTLVHKWCH